jgi:hypothetical protein
MESLVSFARRRDEKMLQGSDRSEVDHGKNVMNTRHSISVFTGLSVEIMYCPFRLSMTLFHESFNKLAQLKVTFGDHN